MSRRIAVAAVVLGACSNVVTTVTSDSAGSGGAGASSATGSGAAAGSTGSGGGESVGSTGSGTAGTGTGGGDAGPPSLTLDAFCAAFAQWYCGMAPSCGCDATSAWPGSVAACAQEVSQSCLANAQELEKEGEVFRGDHAATCLAGLEAGGNQGCINARLLPRPWYACPTMLADPTPLGAACHFIGACAGGDGACDGTTCLAHAGVGQSCPHADCVSGAFCNASHVCQAVGTVPCAGALSDPCAAGLLCGPAGACAPPLAAGAPCTAADACAPGLHCAGGTCQPSPVSCDAPADCGAAEIMTCNPRAALCRAFAAAGEACGAGVIDCGPGLTCHEDFDGGACVPVPGLGEPCPDQACTPGLGCNGTCQPPAAAGQPCNLGPSAVQCAAGLICSDPGQMDGTCVPLAGPPCQMDADCPPDERCADAQVCATPAALGDPCDIATPCAAGDVCDTTRCRQVVGAGAACPDDFTVCATGLACVAGAQFGHGTCQAPPSAGQACDIDLRCADGFACTFLPFAMGHCEPAICFDQTFLP